VPRRGAPDPDLAIARYRELAAGYDASSRREMHRRFYCIDKLRLQPGDTVLDVACGTALSFACLLDQVGPTGRVVGAELSPDMVRLARRRIERAGWRNAELIEGDLAKVVPGAARFDALLFHYTHDVLQSRAALANIFAAAKPGARIAVAALKNAQRWPGLVNAVLNWSVIVRGWRYRTTEDGLDAPWHLLTEWVPDFQWEPHLLDTACIGWGTVRPSPSPSP
jgi:demethylmenaquinone methyltransferase/2-methoxy-6-polyprenyl-1,4-benzoquinol methylase